MQSPIPEARTLGRELEQALALAPRFTLEEPGASANRVVVGILFTLLALVCGVAFAIFRSLG